MKYTKLMFAALMALGLAAPGQAAETVLFSDNFDTDNSTQWTVFGDSELAGDDFTVEWAFDYSNTTYTFNSVASKIPAAPSGTGTKGVKLTVNKDDTADRAAVNLYPTGKTFSGDFALKFDMWLNYNGPAYGGVGSTEFAIFGINHLGTQVNWAATDPSSLLPSSDGVWFGVTGEGGAARDFRTYEGDPAGNPLEYTGVDGGYLDRDGDGTTEQEVVSTASPSYPLHFVFRSPVYETVGAPGKRWIQVEVRQRAGVITWIMNGYVIAEKQNTSLFTEGDIMIGTMDIFASIADPKADNFVIYDNLRVVSLDGAPVPPRVTLSSTANELSEPATAGSITITREGDLTQSLNIFFQTFGTATRGADYQIGLITVPANQTSVTVPVTPTDDASAEADETVGIALLHSPGVFEVFAPMVTTLTLHDDGDTTGVNLTVQDAHAYEKIPSDGGSIKVARVGEMSGDITVNFTLSGDAVAGTDFQSVGTSVIIPSGTESVLIPIVPINNNTINASKTVTLTLAPGTGYAIGTQTTGTVTIRNDDVAPGTLKFSENFEDATSAERWVVNMAHADISAAVFGWDYGTEAGIPIAPNTAAGTTKGLKLQANIGATGVFTGLSVSPIDQGFEGDYRLSFDAWVNFNGPLTLGGTGSTLSFAAGVGTSGDVTQFPGTSIQGVMFSVTGDGGSGSDYRAYVAPGAPLAFGTGAYAAGTQSTALNNTDPYYAPFGGVAAPDAQLAIDPGQTQTTSIGAPGIAWHEISITKIGANITWVMDGVRIATIALTKEISTNIFVGFFDINAGLNGNPAMSFGLVDNLKVESLNTVVEPTVLDIAEIDVSAANQVTIRFTTTGTPASAKVYGSAVPEGPYLEEQNVTYMVIGAGLSQTIIEAKFQVTTANRFFRIGDLAVQAP